MWFDIPVLAVARFVAIHPFRTSLRRLGGREDEADANIVETALRETAEGMTATVLPLTRGASHNV